MNKSYHGNSCIYEPVRKLMKQNKIYTNLRTHIFIKKINPNKIVNYVNRHRQKVVILEPRIIFASLHAAKRGHTVYSEDVSIQSYIIMSLY